MPAPMKIHGILPNGDGSKAYGIQKQLVLAVQHIGLLLSSVFDPIIAPEKFGVNPQFRPVTESNSHCEGWFLDFSGTIV